MRPRHIWRNAPAMLPFVTLLAVLAVPTLGKQLNGHLPFIVNGNDVDTPGKYPYQGSLHFFGRHSCGVAVIGGKYVLSAAHCCSSSTTYYSVYLGVHDVKTKQQGKPKQYAISNMKKNPGYGKGTGLNEGDICIITMYSSIIANDYVQPIDLPSPDAGDMVGATCIITGWGNTKIGSSVAPNILQEGNTTPLSLEDCQNKIKGHPYFDEEDVVDSHICIGAQGSIYPGGCHGDSGGPMACTLNGKQVLAGVTSWGSPDCNPKWPTMYTRITSFRNWIKENTGI